MNDVTTRGNVSFVLNGVKHTRADVYYVPELKTNLLSMGQLQEKGLTIVIKEGVCKIYHPARGLIMETKMTTNRMFKVC